MKKTLLPALLCGIFINTLFATDIPFPTKNAVWNAIHTLPRLSLCIVVAAPSWHTLNFKASCNLNKSIVIQAGCENIFDIQYRVFASGINASGRSFWVSSKVLSE